MQQRSDCLRTILGMLNQFLFKNILTEMGEKKSKYFLFHLLLFTDHCGHNYPT